MNISFNWLKKYLDINEDPVKIGEILTDIGLEIEGMEETESVKGGLKGLVVGHIESCQKHPNADKLSVAQVNIGEAENLSIVCGAPNIAPNQKVIVATIGTTLYSPEGEPWKIKKGKIRGELSQGMICAEDEIGMGSSHEGIMVLDDNIAIGTKASDYFEIENDVIFDVNLTPNRSDATSHMGVARDLGAYLKVNNDYNGDVKEPETSSFHIDQKTHPITVEVEDKTLCPRYAGVVISGITVQESPNWLKNNLSSIGVRPINNIVDITNYILHEAGQPLHAFDYDTITDQKIIVKTLRENTPFLALDEREFSLNKEDLMICDGQELPMCMGGIFGGKNSGVTDQTTTIFLESAHFDAGTIRRSSMKHNLRTDAAKVFEKGSDPNIAMYALKRAAILIKEIAGGIISSDIIDKYPDEIKPKEIHLRYDMVNKIIGTNLDKDAIHKILQAMDMEINPVDPSSIKVFIPTNKADVTREIDLIEEILRIYGFNQVDSATKVTTSLNHEEKPNKRKVINEISDFLATNRYNEMMNLSLIESKYFDDKEEMITINNTSNVHLDIMRPDMLMSGLISVAHNLNRQQTDLNLFEFGKSYKGSIGNATEQEHLTLFRTGKYRQSSWLHKTDADVSFHDLKGDLESILFRLGIQGYQINEEKDERLAYSIKYHRGPNELARIGEISQEYLAKLDIKQDVYYAEINIANILKSLKKTSLQIKDISKYPTVTRDLALVLDENVTFQEIEKLAFKVDKKILKSVTLFDFYKNEEHLGKGKKSYAINFTFISLEKTLNDKEVDKIVNKLIHSFESNLEAKVRK